MIHYCSSIWNVLTKQYFVNSGCQKNESVQFNFCEEARVKITSGILKYPNMLIWFLNMYIRYSNMYIMPNDCFQQFRVSIFITFIGNIN